jgi:hypothetical protein
MQMYQQMYYATFELLEKVEVVLALASIQTVNQGDLAFESPTLT